MLPVPVSSACWRGFVCRYEVAGGRLLLDELSLREHEGRYVPLNGITPKEDHFGAYVYRGLSLPVNFTGRLLLASGFIQELYVHMGFQSPTSYETVLELSFEDGALAGVTDRSADMAAIREAYGQSEESSYSSIVEWITRRFERSIPPEEEQ